MFKKSNDRLGNPVKDKIRLGQPESVKIRSESRTGNPTLADNNRLGQPENYAENQSESRGQPEITEMLSETRLGNPTQTGDQELIESESRSSDLMEFPSETSLIGTPTSSLIIQTSSPRTKKRKRSWDSSEYANKTAKLGAVSSTKSWQSKWLNEFEWLKYENGAMYCSICILHKNKCKFSENGSTNFRISTLHEHETSTGHLRALNLRSDIQSKRIPSVSASITKKVDEIQDAVCRLIRTAYSVAKNNDPFTKYASLCTLQICNGTKLTTSLYQNSRACSDFVSLISESLDNCLLEKIRQSPATGVMIDESTDLSMEKHLIVYVKYLVKGVSCTSFLALIKLSSCDSNVIYNVLVSYLKTCKVDVSKIYGFGSDGAAVMTGKNSGVATRLLSDNPYMLAMHCVAHKLALSCLDAAKSVKEVAYYEGMLHALHSYFSRSHKRIEHLRAWQEILDDPKVKPLAVHQIRWLSFANCVTNVRRTLPSLLKSLQSDSEEDPMAESLYNATATYKFLYLTHFFSDIMSDVAMLSRKFQERELNYSDLKKTLVATCDSIEQQYLAEDPSLGSNLREFVDKYSGASLYHEFEIRRSHRDKLLPDVVTQFATLLLESMRSRFPKLELWDALSIFQPNTFPSTVAAKAKFGKQNIANLLAHYGEKRGSNTPPIDPDQAKQEWSLFKNHMFAIAAGSTEDEPVTMSSLAEEILSSEQMLREYPNMTKLLAFSRVLPVSSVECERGFSTQNLIKTRLRCSLSIENLDRLMRISINGPSVEDFDPLPIYRMWRTSDVGTGRHIFKNTTKQGKLIE